jgi:hypothetical protein
MGALGTADRFGRTIERFDGLADRLGGGIGLRVDRLARTCARRNER